MSSGVTIVFDFLPEIAAGMTAKAAAAVAKAAHDIEAGAKAEAPIDTGALRNSIQANPEGALAWVIAVGIEYGIYQEFGTSKMPAHPFLIPAFTRVAPTLIASLSELAAL